MRIKQIAVIAIELFDVKPVFLLCQKRIVKFI